MADGHQDKAEQLALFGGPDGVRDQGMLESALGRPVNKFTYGETDLAALAAAIVAVVASWASFGISLSALVVVLLALPFGAVGGKLGLARRLL